MQIGHGTTVDGRSPESPVLLSLRSTLFLLHTKHPPYALRMQSYVKNPDMLHRPRLYGGEFYGLSELHAGVFPGTTICTT